MQKTWPCEFNQPIPKLTRRISRHPPQFSDPVFTGLAAQVHTGYHIASSPAPGDHSRLITGLAFYLITMACLTGWEEFVVPKLQDAGLLPEIPGTVRYIRHKRLSKEGRKLPWATPLTSDRTLPTLDEIVKRAVRVSGQKDVVQLIKAHVETEEREPQHEKRPTDGEEFEADELCAVCRVSPEFSDHCAHSPRPPHDSLVPPPLPTGRCGHAC